MDKTSTTARSNLAYFWLGLRTSLADGLDQLRVLLDLVAFLVSAFTVILVLATSKAVPYQSWAHGGDTWFARVWLAILLWHAVWYVRHWRGVWEVLQALHWPHLSTVVEAVKALGGFALVCYIAIGGLPGVAVALDLYFGNSKLATLSGLELVALPAGAVMVVGLVSALVWQQYERLVGAGRANAQVDLTRWD